jgi:hypothetical protein
VKTRILLLILMNSVWIVFSKKPPKKDIFCQKFHSSLSFLKANGKSSKFLVSLQGKNSKDKLSAKKLPTFA